MSAKGNRHFGLDFRGFAPFSRYCLPLSNLWTQYGHALDIPGQANQIPFAGDFAQTAHRELPETHHRFDDAKDRLDRLLGVGVSRFTCYRVQTMRHGLHRRSILGQRSRLCKALTPVRVVVLAATDSRGSILASSQTLILFSLQ